MRAQDICLSCGLCCDGTLFADVKLTPAEAAQLPSATPGGSSAPCMHPKRPRLPQPCFAWENGRCSVYGSRPGHCRKFDCDLLSKIQSGETRAKAGLSIIRKCRDKAAEVRALLRSLGETNEPHPLTRRFQNVSRRMQKQRERTSETARYGDLTIAMHELHCLLSEHIYPV